MNKEENENYFSKTGSYPICGPSEAPTEKEPKRVLLTAKVLPQTKQNIDRMRGEISIGKLLDDNLGAATPLPPAWGDDELTQFLKIATENGYATYVQEKVFWPRLQKIDSLFYRVSQNMDNTRDWFYTFFYFRAHSVWRAAIRLAISGQNPETHILLRASLEHAMYAFFIFNDKTSWKDDNSRFMIWMNREVSDIAEKKCRNTFTAWKIKEELKEKNKQLGEIVEKIYDQAISHGAHPNVHGTLGNVSLEEDGKTRRMTTQYLNGETDSYKFSLKRACQTGLCILLIFKVIFKERFDILGVSDEIDKLKRGL